MGFTCLDTKHPLKIKKYRKNSNISYKTMKLYLKIFLGEIGVKWEVDKFAMI
jgi:hypothetical protein